MGEAKKDLEGLHKEFVRFERAMEELRFLKIIAQDLRNFRRMLRFRRYD